MKNYYRCFKKGNT